MRARLLATSALWLLAWPAFGQEVGDVVTFGDSLSDSGNIPGLTGGVNFPPSPPYAGNRFSNGAVFSEVLPGLLGGAFDPTLNFATGGALTGADNLNSNRPNADPESDLTSIVLPGIETQVDGFLATGGQLDEDDVVIVYGGANDVFVAAETAATLPADQIPDLVQSTAATAAQNLATSVVKLNSVGGETFILPNLPDIGATPSFTAGGADSIALGTGFTRAHNLALGEAAASLQAQTGANVVVFDISGILNDIQANPDRYGITNTTEACIDTVACVTGDQATQNQFLYFDSVHPTAGVHAQVANILATTVRAPTTIAAQGDVTLEVAEDFQRSMIESFNPIAATASATLGRDSTPAARLDTAEGKSAGEALDRLTDLFLLVDRTEGERDAREGALGYDYDVTSLTVGLRQHLDGPVSLGAALRIGAGDADIDGGQESFDHKEAQFGLGVTLGEERSYLTGFANLGYADLSDIERESGVDGVVSEGSTDGIIYGAGVAAGHLIGLGEGVRFGPLGSARYAAVDIDEYVESGPNFLNQRVEEQDDIESLVVSVGAALELGWHADKDAEAHDVRLRVTGLLEHETLNDDREIESAFVSSPTTLVTTIGAGDQTRGRVGADLGVRLTDGIDFGVGYETLIGSDDSDQHSLYARAVIAF